MGDRRTGMFGYAWRIWWGRTSFYVKARHAPLSSLKVSLHGPDEGHGLPGFKVDAETSALNAEVGGLGVSTPGWLPCWYDGREVRQGVRHVLRLRTPWTVLQPGRSSAPNPGDVRSSASAGLIPAPARHHAADIDLYVCEKTPYWPDERRARRANALFGPLRNEAGQYLTGMSVQRPLITSPTPAYALATEPRDDDDAVRGIGGTVDDDLLWLCEQWMSASSLRAAADAGNAASVRQCHLRSNVGATVDLPAGLTRDLLR